MTDRYEEIRKALAMGPTPGEWYWTDAYPTQDGRKTWSLIGDGGFGILSCDGEENSPQSVNAAAAELIAACDPDTIRALLEERDTLLDALSEAQMHIAAIGYPASPDGAYNKDGEWTFSDAVPRAVDAEEVKAAFLIIRAAIDKVGN